MEAWSTSARGDFVGGEFSRNDVNSDWVRCDSEF